MWFGGDESMSKRGRKTGQSHSLSPTINLISYSFFLSSCDQIMIRRRRNKINGWAVAES
jgi:hypothetical protein